MTSEIKDILENMTTAAPEMEDYIGEDGLLYCGKCHTPKEAYFPEGKELFGRDRHPAECDCQRAAREQRQAAEEHRRHVEAVENLKQRAFADSAMQQWTFENDNGRNPQTGIARRYAEHWEEMQAENIGCLFWGNVGNGKSYLAGCIANALMEKEVPVYMTNFAVILGDLSPGFTGRNEYISRLCRYPLLICKICAALPPEKQAEEMTITRLVNLPWRLSKEQLSWLKKRMKDRRDAVRTLATEQYEIRFPPRIELDELEDDFEEDFDFYMDEETDIE